MIFSGVSNINKHLQYRHFDPNLLTHIYNSNILLQLSGNSFITCTTHNASTLGVHCVNYVILKNHDLSKILLNVIKNFKSMTILTAKKFSIT